MRYCIIIKYTPSNAASLFSGLVRSITSWYSLVGMGGGGCVRDGSGLAAMIKCQMTEVK